MSKKKNDNADPARRRRKRNAGNSSLSTPNEGEGNGGTNQPARKSRGMSPAEVELSLQEWESELEALWDETLDDGDIADADLDEQADPVLLVFLEGLPALERQRVATEHIREALGLELDRSDARLDEVQHRVVELTIGMADLLIYSLDCLSDRAFRWLLALHGKDIDRFEKILAHIWENPDLHALGYRVLDAL